MFEYDLNINYRRWFKYFLSVSGFLLTIALNEMVPTDDHCTSINLCNTSEKILPGTHMSVKFLQNNFASVFGPIISSSAAW